MRRIALDHGFGLVYFSLFVVYLTDDRIDTYIIIRVDGCYAGKRSVEPPTGNLRHSLSYRIYILSITNFSTYFFM